MTFSKPQQRSHCLTLGLAFCSLMALLAPRLARAKTTPLALCVDPAGAGGCFTTIQGAVNSVPAGGDAVITIAAGTYLENLTVSGITVSFIGAGVGQTIVDGSVDPSLSTFTFQTQANGELHGMTIQNGGGPIGGNILFDQQSPKTGKGVGSLTIENCEITGGMPAPHYLPEHTVFFWGKSLVVDSTTIANNNVGGLAIYGSPHVYITNTTITGNSTPSNTASAAGCGLRISSGTIVLNNVTITDNHCVGTVGSGHQPTQGGGIWLDFPPKVSMANTVIANNTVAGASPSGPDCWVAGNGLKSKGFNLIEDVSACAIKLLKSDIAPGKDPALSPLQACASTGLEVLAPLTGSPLIASGNPATPKGKVGAAGSSCLPLDECGNTRTAGSCTIGASQ